MVVCKKTYKYISISFNMSQDEMHSSLADDVFALSTGVPNKVVFVMGRFID